MGGVGIAMHYGTIWGRDIHIFTKWCVFQALKDSHNALNGDSTQYFCTSQWLFQNLDVTIDNPWLSKKMHLSRDWLLLQFLRKRKYPGRNQNHVIKPNMITSYQYLSHGDDEQKRFHSCLNLLVGRMLTRYLCTEISINEWSTIRPPHHSLSGLTAMRGEGVMG